jgi:hypothetical protein
MLTRVKQIVNNVFFFLQIERGEFNPNMDHSESNNLIVYTKHGYMTQKTMNIKLCTDDEKAKPDKLAIVKRLNFFMRSTSYQITYQSLDNFNGQQN